MKKVTYYRIIMWSLVLLTMVAIFFFSSHTSQKSTQLSDKAFEIIQEIVSETTSSNELSTLTVKEKTDFILVIRKSAHALIYSLLGFLLMGSFSLYELKSKTRLVVSLLIGLIYAASDEWHQTFVPGRSGKITDVAIDFGGLIIGICLMLILIRIINKIKKYKASA